LEEIAHLNKRGPYALKWSLKPHYIQSQQGLNAQNLTSNGGTGTSDTQGVKTEPKAEDDVKMEDIL
jgi:hypothetical protein